jgi:transposase
MMKELDLVDEKIARITDLLEQIQELDKMILLHQQKGDSQDIMLLQYQKKRRLFLREMGQVFIDLNINPADFAA